MSLPKEQDMDNNICKAAETLTKEGLTTLSETHQKHRCLYCKHEFKRPYEVKKHYMSCGYLREKIEQGDKSIPEHVLEDIEKFRKKRKDSKKRKLEKAVDELSKKATKSKDVQYLKALKTWILDETDHDT